MREDCIVAGQLVVDGQGVDVEDHESCPRNVKRNVGEQETGEQWTQQTRIELKDILHCDDIQLTMDKQPCHGQTIDWPVQQSLLEHSGSLEKYCQANNRHTGGKTGHGKYCAACHKDDESDRHRYETDHSQANRLEGVIIQFDTKSTIQ